VTIEGEFVSIAERVVSSDVQPVGEMSKSARKSPGEFMGPSQ
jgi:hypothetical protein